MQMPPIGGAAARGRRGRQAQPDRPPQMVRRQVMAAVQGRRPRSSRGERDDAGDDRRFPNRRFKQTDRRGRRPPGGSRENAAADSATALGLGVGVSAREACAWKPSQALAALPPGARATCARAPPASKGDAQTPWLSRWRLGAPCPATHGSNSAGRQALQHRAGGRKSAEQAGSGEAPYRDQRRPVGRADIPYLDALSSATGGLAAARAAGLECLASATGPGLRPRARAGAARARAGGPRGRAPATRRSPAATLARSSRAARAPPPRTVARGIAAVAELLRRLRARPCRASAAGAAASAAGAAEQAAAVDDGAPSASSRATWRAAVFIARRAAGLLAELALRKQGRAREGGYGARPVDDRGAARSPSATRAASSARGARDG